MWIHSGTALLRREDETHFSETDKLRRRHDQNGRSDLNRTSPMKIGLGSAVESRENPLIAFLQHPGRRRRMNGDCTQAAMEPA